MRSGISLSVIAVLVAIATQQVGAAPDKRSIGCPADSPLDQQIRSLVALLATRDQQAVQFAVDSLRSFGPEAEHSIACRLEDRRPIQVSRVYFLNSAEHWELHATYGPELVIDILATILRSPEGGASVCSLHNGGTKEARSACVAAWAERYPETQ